MTRRINALILLVLAPTLSLAWIPTGSRYEGATITIQLGDICDVARFPDTPGACTGGEGDPDWVQEVQTALARWNSATPNFVFMTDPADGASVPGTCDSDDPNSAFFLDDICGQAFGATTLAVARTSSILGGIAVHSDVIFNSAITWGAFDDSLGNHLGEDDFRRVAVHEFGHVAGLNHPPHVNAIMFFAEQDVIAPQADDLAGVSAIYGIAKVFRIPDLNSNGVDEIGVVKLTTDGTTVLEVKDANTGSLLRLMTYFSSGEAIRPLDAALLPDDDLSGAPEFAVLGIRRDDGRPIVEIRNLSGPENLRSLRYGVDMTPLALRSIGDADGDGISELAVLGTILLGLQPVVEIRNSIDDQVRRRHYHDFFTTAYDMEVLHDPLGAAPPRLAVLLQKWTDGRGIVNIRSSFGDQNEETVRLRTTLFPFAMATVNNADPRIAVLSTRLTDSRLVVDTMDADAPFAVTTQNFAYGYEPLDVALIDDGDNDGGIEIAVLSRRDYDARTILQIRELDGSSSTTIRYSDTADTAASMAFLNDTDGDTFPEAAVYMSRQTDAVTRVERANTVGAGTIIRRVYFTQ